PRSPASSLATVFSSPASLFSSSLTGSAFTRLCTAFTRSPPAAGARRRAVVLTRLTVRLTAVGTPPLLRLVLAILDGPPCFDGPLHIRTVGFDVCDRRCLKPPIGRIACWLRPHLSPV